MSRCPAVLVTVILLARSAAFGQDKAELRAVLSAREEAVKSFQADLVVVTSVGDDLDERRAAQLQYADWLDEQHPEYKAENQKFRSRVSRTLPNKPETSRHAYAAEATGRIRIQHIKDPGAGADVADDFQRVWILDGDQWKRYSEFTDPKAGGRTGNLTIYEQESGSSIWHEVARGGGVALGQRFDGSLKFDVSRRARAVWAMTWSELLRHLPPELSREETSMPPGGTAPRPSLVFESAPFRDTGKGLYRLSLWFAPEHGYAVEALAASDLQPAGGQKWDFLPQYVVTWSQPVDAGGDLTVFQKCLIRSYEHFHIPTEGAAFREWPYKAYERMRYDYTFSNIQLNKPLDPSLFSVHPIAGTNVIDEPKGYLYVVGNAGEELHKTALAERARRSPDDAGLKRAVPWRMILTIANVVALLALTAYWFFVRKRRSEKKP